jgi:hypothetical protein
MGDEQLFDVVEVEIRNPSNRRVIASGKTERNADAIVRMAVIRRGVQHHFFTTVPHAARPSPKSAAE